MHRAFTLIELLVTIAIIGLISSVALVALKDTAEVKALSLTKEVMQSIKVAIADTDSDGYFTGFVNDFGTMPPNVYFLIGTQDDNKSFNFVDGSLAKYKFSDMTVQDDTKFPAPFMEEQFELKNQINKVIYVGYHGGYMNKDLKNKTFNDGWNTPIILKNDFNVSTNNNDENFLTLVSYGSDRATQGKSLVRAEYDLSQDDGSVENFYSDDYNTTYKKNRFVVKSLDIDIDIQEQNATKVAIFIYSPMLYYVENSEGEVCTENNETHATCDGIDKRYIAYYPFVDSFDNEVADKNVSWHIGLMKQQLYFDDQNLSGLFINKKGISEILVDTSYNFSASGDSNLSDSIFFGNMSVDINNTSYTSSSDKDTNNPFFMYSGIKVISIWNNANGWKEQESFVQTFKPNKRVLIKSMSN